MTRQFLGGVCAGAFVSAAVVIFLPISASVPCSGTTAFARLEEVTGRNNLQMGAYTARNILAYCAVNVELAGDDSYKIRRLASTCEAAATEILKTLEARNVR